MRRFSYECRCGKEFDIFLERGIPVPSRKKCECGKMADRLFKMPGEFSDIGTLHLSSLLPLEYDHSTRGKVDKVEGNYALREHLKRYNDKYQVGLEVG